MTGVCLYVIFLFMRCKVCNKEFSPSKYNPSQQTCSSSECQHLRQLLNEREWRGRNPDYFRCHGQDQVWQENRYRYVKLWRLAHRDYLREYAKSHAPQRREYMREYMRRYRQSVRQPTM